jgi:N-acetylglucosaminyldiphosphoundecaprenol N-acetyl-beta-D-mannosaminyltransferase
MQNSEEHNNEHLSLPIQNVIGHPITALQFADVIDLIVRWATQRLSKVVCFADIHPLMEANSNPRYAKTLLDADLVVPESMALVWIMKLLGVRQQDRVGGMDLFQALCHKVSSTPGSIFFLGSDISTLELMRQRINQDFPHLQIAGMEPLPFRPMTSTEDAEMIQKINESGASIVLVSLGCPKQEIWMIQHRDKIKAVMLGLGGVFRIYARVYKWAPTYIRKSGLTWLYRLTQEPRRLWKRFYKTVPPFVYLVLKQILLQGTSISASNQETTNKLIQNLPEEYRADLEALRSKLLKANTHEWTIKLIILKALSEIYWAIVQIKVENLFSGTQHNTDKN